MDLGGIPDGNDVSGDDGVTDDVHHDPLNENFEETWSALGEQDARSSAGSDPGMLPPPIPVLPTSLGSIIGQPFEHQGMSQLSVLRADVSSSIISINASREKSELQLSDDNRVRDPSKLRLELEFTASNHMQIALVTSASHDHHKAFYKDDVKSKAILSSKSSPSLYRSCSITSKPSSVIGNGSLFCRICHEGGSSEQFISPCCCRGSLSRVHKTCLERWLAESDSSHCELCGYKYRTKRVPKYGLMSSIFAWLTSNSTSRERRNLLIDILALLIISPIIGLSTILALQLADSLFILESMEKMEQTEIRVLPRRGIEPDFSNKSHTTLEVVGTMISRLGQMGIISMVITMDMAYISWVAMRLQAHVTKWYTWYRRNCKVTLIGYPDQKNSHAGLNVLAIRSLETPDAPEAADTESRNTPNDQQSLIKSKIQGRQMTPIEYGVFRAIVVWFTLKRSRDDRIEMALDILKLSAALAVLFVINYQTLELLGSIQRLDMSLQDFVDPFIEPELNWNDLAEVGNKILKMLSLAVATPITLDYIATKMHNLDFYISPQLQFGHLILKRSVYCVYRHVEVKIAQAK
ncbi:unnamed protein product [Nezara viridula]|uniref:RING-CH-type domain-containing protein n=1 Tax=Nezara viridula TaxID=85310 RepID=A0A9P0MVS7_NEZVI|nr:unnamed protein product [Nezara viridula]